MSKEFLKGAFLLTLAKIFFLFASYAIYFGLAHILGPVQFGIYGVVIGLISILNMALITGTVQAVSKFVSAESPETREAVKNTTLRIQIVLAGGLFIVYFVLAPHIAAVLNDAGLTKDLRTAGVIFLSYAFYAVFIGYLNGKKEFGKQAALDISYSTLKLVLILGLSVLGFQARGAIAGFAAASVAILLVSIVFVGLSREAGHFDWRKMLGFEMTIMGLAFVINLMMNLDLLMLKALSPPHEGSLNAGLYTAAATIARVPYQLLAGVNLAIFPLVAGSVSRGRTEEARNQIRLGMRLVFGVTVLAAVGIASSSRETAQLIYPEAFARAAQPLTLLAFAYLCFSFWVFMGTILTASGHPKKTLLLGIGTLGCQFLLLFLMIPMFGSVGAAWGSLLSWLLGVLIGSLLVERKIGTLIPSSSFLKITFCGLTCYFVSLLWTAERLMLLMKDGLLVVLYVALLIFAGEITKRDWENIQKLKKGT
jgi:PST family polysaccharide transporter